MTPLTKMYTLGHTFVPPGIHAGGLRYHGMSPIISKLCARRVTSRPAPTTRRRSSRRRSSSPAPRASPAPESAHAIRAAIDEALAAREAGERRVILFNLSGHGHFDLGAYDQYLVRQAGGLRLPGGDGRGGDGRDTEGAERL